jgi:sugar lactone lactonase YvrE
MALKSHNILSSCLVGIIFFLSNNALHAHKTDYSAELFATLPESCPTPDAFAVAPDGTLTVSCPNYAEGKIPGMLLSITLDGDVREIGTITLPNGKTSRPMGLAYGPNGSLFVCDPGNGNLLKTEITVQGVNNVEIIATGMSSPNGLRYKDGYLYLTQLQLPKASSPLMTSGLYQFHEDDRNITVASDGSSPNLLFSTETQNPARQFGLDGIVFDKQGRLYVGDFGDAIIYRLIFDEQSKLVESERFSQLPLSTGVDGLTIDDDDNLYVAGFLQNQLIRIDQNGNFKTLLSFPDNNGAKGELDQPADLIYHNNRLYISNFDLMNGPGITNSGHSKPYTLTTVDLK